MCALADDVADPVACPLDGAQFRGGEVRKDEDEQFGWKAEECRRAGLERHDMAALSVQLCSNSFAACSHGPR